MTNRLGKRLWVPSQHVSTSKVAAAPWRQPEELIIFIQKRENRFVCVHMSGGSRLKEFQSGTNGKKSHGPKNMYSRE